MKNIKSIQRKVKDMLKKNRYKILFYPLEILHGERDRSMYKSLAFLFKYVWKFNKIYLFYAITYQFVSAVIPLANILVPKYIIDELVDSKRIDYLTTYAVMLVGINFIWGILSTFLQGKMTISKNVIFYKFQTYLTKNISECDYGQIESAEYLDIKEKAQRFLYANGSGFGLVESALNIIGKVSVFAGVIGILSTLNIWIVLIFIALVLLNSFVESLSRKTIAQLDLENTVLERKSYYLVTTIEDFKAGKEIRLYALADFLVRKMVAHFQNVQILKTKQINKKNNALYFVSLTTGCKDLFAYLYIINRVIVGAISIGSFSMYISAVFQFSSAMTSVMQSILDVNQFKVYFDAFEQFTQVKKTMRTGTSRVPEPPYVLRFEDVSFKYPNQNKCVLKNINLQLVHNERLSIIGENGAGKTTLVKLLMRLYDPTEGRILLNDIDIRTIDYEAYESILSAVFQDYKLFSFTLKENVAFDLDADDQLIQDYLTNAGFGDKLKKLDKGIYSYIYKNFGEDGFEPSGGEGQKIAIARALYKKNAKVIILDEPTAALDPRAEFEIYKNFSELVKDKTAIYISHRLSSARFCDRIVVLKNGEIVEHGTFDELYKKEGEFKELYDMQAQFYV